MKTKTSGEFALGDTIDDLGRRGFTGHFGVTANGLREFGTGVTFQATELRIRDWFRVEDSSDPGDIAIVYVIESERVAIGRAAGSGGRVRAA